MVPQNKHAKTLGRPRHLDAGLPGGSSGRDSGCTGCCWPLAEEPGASRQCHRPLLWASGQQQHILIAVDLIAAAKAGHQEQFQEHDRRWTQNAQDIAAFLAGANPNWPAQDVADLLNLHLELTKKEAVARLTEKWEEDIAAFDDIFTEIMTVSDTLSEGIIKQFPDKF